MLDTFSILTDVSLDVKKQFGVGACLLVSEADVLSASIDTLQARILHQPFVSTSSTQLEVESALWALGKVSAMIDSGTVVRKLTLYTDSQCIAGLLDRREKLEHSRYISITKKQPLKNAVLYQKFYLFWDQYPFEVEKIKGHLKKSQQNRMQTIFSCVDKAARRQLKQAVAAHFGKNDKM